MKADPAPMAVADYCQQLIEGKITVNRDYQREEKIWSPYIRSNFIESILLEYPIPKLFLYVTFDLQSRKSKKEIVDGQQRSHALRMFYENRMKISPKIETEEIRGKKYRDLDERYRQIFLSYSLPVDEFRSVSEDDIRESFARMNVHNITLNPEELRNAKFNGEFKRFIIQVSKAFRELLIRQKVLSRRDTVRMADHRLFSEIAFLLDNGFGTTRGPEIDALYKKYDSDFPHEQAFTELIASACREWNELELAQYEEFTSKHSFYTLIAALIEARNPGAVIRHLSDDEKDLVETIRARAVTMAQLNAEVVAFKEAKAIDEEPNIWHAAFVNACTVKTNVGAEKLTRFAYFLSALEAYD